MGRKKKNYPQIAVASKTGFDMFYHSNFHQHQTLHKLRILYEYFRVQLLLSTKYCLIVTMMGVVLIHLKLIFLPFLTPVPSY